MSKNKEIDRGLKGLGSQLFGALKKEVKLRVSVRCNECGGYKSSFLDSSPCPHPETLPHDGVDYDDHATITMVPSPERDEPKVTRIEKRVEETRKKVNPKYKAEPVEPLPAPVTYKDEGQYKRKPGLNPNDPFLQKMDRMLSEQDYESGFGSINNKDKEYNYGDEKDVPIYTIGD
jgi:hypothetical protein